MQRAQGRVRAVFVAQAGMTSVANLREAGSAKMRLPRQYASATEAVLINTAGGLAGGDRFAVSIHADDGVHVSVTTQANERVYRSSGKAASVETALTVGANARLDWLPQETIMFDRAKLRRSYAIDLAPTATLLAIEGIVLGRIAMGETVKTGDIHDRWRVRRGGRLIFADDLRMEGEIGSITAHSASLAKKLALGTIIFVGIEAERHVDRVRAAIGEDGGASAFDGKLIARVVADDGHQLRQLVCAVIGQLSGGAALPRVWQ